MAVVSAVVSSGGWPSAAFDSAQALYLAITGSYWSEALRVLPSPLMLARTFAVWMALSLYSSAISPPGHGRGRGAVGVAGSSSVSGSNSSRTSVSTRASLRRLLLLGDIGDDIASRVARGAECRRG